MAPEVGSRSLHVDTYRLRTSVCAALDATVCILWGMEGKHGHSVQSHSGDGTTTAVCTMRNAQDQASGELRQNASRQGTEGRRPQRAGTCLSIAEVTRRTRVISHETEGSE